MTINEQRSSLSGTHSDGFTDFQIVIASVNGSGTLTANRILHKTLFREGYHVIGKNLFPSNIEGLPTYYFLRISKKANSLKTKNEVYIALNPNTYEKDLKTLVSPQTEFLLNSDLKLQEPESHPHYALSFRKTVSTSKASIKIKRRMSNMSYVGWLTRYLNLNIETLKEVIKEQFSSPTIAEENMKATLEGWNAFEGTPIILNSSLKMDNSKNILIEGNQASALGWVDQGCMVATWYPITPSTSLVESFESYAKSLRPKTTAGEYPVAVVQSEDEISAIASVVGAGWAGARAATATSGPGLSLMSEAIGLAYFAEIPAVICDVQRVGPSTGLPTRTSQGDIEFAFKISHGDTFHPLLLPSTPKECYEMSALAFDIADKYQTPVMVMSDLDLGMNLWTSPKLQQVSKPYERSQILTELDLEKLNSEGQKFQRYLGNDLGIPNRTVPGTHHSDAAYFTRGSGHNESSHYSESPEDYERLMERLKLKILNARLDLPSPVIKNYSKENTTTDVQTSSSSIQVKSKDINSASLKKDNHEKQPSSLGIIYYGSTGQVFPELIELLWNSTSFTTINTCQIKSLPLHQEVLQFINDNNEILVIEQNRDGQLRNIILQNEDYTPAKKLHSVKNFDGWSVQADKVFQKIKDLLGTKNGL